jgi:drug/metabolite transporter (DMT)-like permease
MPPNGLHHGRLAALSVFLVAAGAIMLISQGSGDLIISAVLGGLILSVVNYLVLRRRREETADDGTEPRPKGLRVREWVPLTLFVIAAAATFTVREPWGLISAMSLGALSLPVFNSLVLRRRREQAADPAEEPGDSEESGEG